MSDVRKTPARNAQPSAANSKPTSTEPVRSPVRPLSQVVDQIRRDARRDPAQYVDEVDVPFGGE